MQDGTSLRRLTEKELDQVGGGAIEDNFVSVTINGGGKTPNGNANGIEPTDVYVDSTNPAGHPPPGQQL
jgi:hypothetical protein